MIRALLLLVAGFALVGARPAPDWSNTFSTTPTGAFVRGNPAAKVRLVEYMSFTCDHCARFATQSAQPLARDYIAKGTVAVEFRNAVRDGVDLTAALLARCGGPARGFGTALAIFAEHDAILQRFSAYAPRMPDADLRDVAKTLRHVTRGSGMDAIMRRRGFTPAQVEACLSDKAAFAVVERSTREAFEERRIEGTPTFLINGVQTGGNWATIEALLRARVAG